MKALIIALLLVSNVFAGAPYVSFSAPTFIPALLPACKLTPFVATSTVIYEYTVWDCHGIASCSSSVTGTGTGYCSGAGAYCAISPLGPKAPYFKPNYTVDFSTYPARFWIFVVVSSINDGNLPQGYGCGTTHLTTGPHTWTSRPPCP